MGVEDYDTFQAFHFFLSDRINLEPQRWMHDLAERL